LERAKQILDSYCEEDKSFENSIIRDILVTGKYAFVENIKEYSDDEILKINKVQGLPATFTKA